MELDLTMFGKGAIPTPVELAATRYKLAASAPQPINWSKPLRPEFLTVLNQGSSSSCTAHATAYYCMALERDEYQKDEVYSRRFIYSQTHFPGGGSYIWKAMSIPLKVGLASEASVPDGLDEITETDNSLNATAAIEARADKYAQISNTHEVDSLAQIVDEYGGFITGFNGNNDIMKTAVVGIPDHVDWGHAVYVYDYCLLPDGRKALKFINSWTDAWGERGYGYFTEDFVKSGYMFDAYVYADLQDIDPSSMKLTLATDGAHYGNKVFAITENPKIRMWVPNPETLLTGNGAGLWGGFPDIISKDLTEYTEGVIQISVSK